jgi:hypothetical protein
MVKKVNQSRKKETQKKLKLSPPLIVLVIVIIAAAGYLIYDNFFKSKVTEVQEYFFTKEGELSFTDSTGNLIKKVDLEIADSEYDRQLGLMFRRSMTENQAMLFIFPYERIQSFWMRNTNISLDMIFVNKDKKIITIHKNTRILSDQSYPSSEPAMYVVEVIAGFTDKYNIKVGDRIEWIDNKINM